MSPESLQIRLRKLSFRVFVALLAALSFMMLPGCGEKKAEENDGEEVDEEVRMATKAFRKESAKKNARNAKLQIMAFEQALDSYRLDVGRYPSDLQCLIENIDQEPKWNGPYMKSIPKDPWGMEYQYTSEGVHNRGSFDLCSLGADGMEGAEGENDDITNWTEE